MSSPTAPSRSSPTPFPPNFMLPLSPCCIHTKINQNNQAKAQKNKQARTEEKYSPQKREQNQTKKHRVSLVLINLSCPKV